MRWKQAALPCLFAAGHVPTAIPSRSPFRRLPAENVNHGEDDHPNGVDKMPIERQHFETLRVGLAHAAAQGEHESESQHDQADDNVRRVQTDQRVESSAKEIGADGKTILVDELVPF